MNPNYKPLVSVVMPCYNAAAYLEQAVGSVLGQTLADLELIVVDDGSRDASPEILARLAQEDDRLRLLHQDNRGPYPARNLGLRHARGKYVAFLDADDWWDRTFLEKMHRALSESGADLAYCGWQNVGLEGKRGDPYVPPDYELEDKAERFLKAAAPWPIHAALTRREVIDEVGGFNVTLPTCMDYDLWLRIAVTRPIQRVPEVLAYYRHHRKGQITDSQWRQAKNVWLVKRNFIQTHPHLIQHLGRKKLQELTNGSLLQRGYDNFWKRDLISAHHIFRMVLRSGGWSLRDLKYLLPALLPLSLYLLLIGVLDRQKS